MAAVSRLSRRLNASDRTLVNICQRTLRLAFTEDHCATFTTLTESVEEPVLPIYVTSHSTFYGESMRRESLLRASPSSRRKIARRTSELSRGRIKQRPVSFSIISSRCCISYGYATSTTYVQISFRMSIYVTKTSRRRPKQSVRGDVSVDTVVAVINRCRPTTTAIQSGDPWRSTI